jgi:hypothetical protein
MIGSVTAASSKLAQTGGVGRHQPDDHESERYEHDIQHESLRVERRPSTESSCKDSILNRGRRHRDSIKTRGKGRCPAYPASLTCL